jgi:hypothetical protein
LTIIYDSKNNSIRLFRVVETLFRQYDGRG